MRYTAVFVGPTGCGKSTAINAMANYLKYKNFGETFEKNEPEIVIPVNFHVNTGSITNTKVVALPGRDYTEGNEQFGSGGSSTQKPLQHLLDLGSGDELLIVDTPGLCDTRGSDIDKQNINQIIDELNKLEKVYAIVIFLGATLNKLTEEFQYVIATLLSRLHKKAANNVFFVFTNTYSSDFEPGDAFIALTDLLQSNETLRQRVVAAENNCVSIDSIGFCGQCIKHTFPEVYNAYNLNHNMYEKCWNISKEKMMSLVEAIKNKKPHKIGQSVSVAQAPDVIVLLSEPLAIATQLITTYRESLGNDIDNVLREFKNKLQSYDIELSELKNPRTVCSSQKCIKVFRHEGTFVSQYDTICHDSCHLEGVEVVKFPESRLKDCNAFGGSDYCLKCGCSWEEHMHIDFEQKQVLVKNNVSNRLEEITSLSEAEDQQQHLAHLVSDLEKEQDCINETMVKFAVYLKRNSLLLDSSYVVNHLKAEIRKAEGVAAVSKEQKDLERVNLLKSNQKTQETRQAALEAAIGAVEGAPKGRNKEISVDDITTLRQELFNLDIMGDKIKSIYDKLYTKSEAAKHATRELPC